MIKSYEDSDYDFPKENSNAKRDDQFQSSVKSQQVSSLGIFTLDWEKYFDLTFVALPCDKVIFVFDKNYITSAIRKFMLDMPSPGSFQNIVLQIYSCLP